MEPPLVIQNGPTTHSVKKTQLHNSAQMPFQNAQARTQIYAIT